MRDMPRPPDFSPKYALGSWAFSFGPFAAAPWSFERVCRYAADAGYHGIEINGFRPHPHPDDYDTDAKCRELAHFLADLGLGVSAYAPDFRAAPPAETDSNRYLAEFGKALRFCERLGIDMLRVDTVAPPESLTPARYEERRGRLIRNWHAAATACAAANVTLAWEFEPGFWLNRPSEVLSLAAAIDHPAFGVLFDTSHAYMCAVIGARQEGVAEGRAGGDLDFARRVRPYLGHFHLIDSDGRLHNGETSVHAPFGTGRVDFPAVLQALAPEVWQLEWWGVDFCFCPTTERDARAAVPFLNQLLASLP